jgi:hypothetical protein
MENRKTSTEEWKKDLSRLGMDDEGIVRRSANSYLSCWLSYDYQVGVHWIVCTVLRAFVTTPAVCAPWEMISVIGCAALGVDSRSKHGMRRSKGWEPGRSECMRRVRMQKVMHWNVGVGVIPSDYLGSR